MLTAAAGGRATKRRALAAEQKEELCQKFRQNAARAAFRIQQADVLLPAARLLERYAGVYLPVVLSVAGVTLFVTGELERAVAVLIVSCPCALVLAGPAAMVVAMTASTVATRQRAQTKARHSGGC